MSEKKNYPLISIVIPVYNVENYLKECVDSVLNQSFSDYEIILVDDGATDSSGNICDDYAAKDKRVSVIHQPNGGLSSARNTGLKAATGEFVYFLDSDDYIRHDSFELLHKIAVKEKSDVVFFDASVFFTGCKPDPKVYKYERSRKYQTANGKEVLLELLNTDEYRTAVPLMFFKKSYLEDNSIYFKEGILHEDELFTFLVFNANGIVSHCHEELYARRMRAQSIMTASSILKRYESMYLIYFDLSGMYSDKQIFGKAAELYLARIARSVLAKYILLDEKLQNSVLKKHNLFKKNVIEQNGFGDLKLKIKCSSGIRNIYYRFVNKYKNTK